MYDFGQELANCWLQPVCLRSYLFWNQLHKEIRPVEVKTEKKAIDASKGKTEKKKKKERSHSEIPAIQTKPIPSPPKARRA